MRAGQLVPLVSTPTPSCLALQIVFCCCSTFLSDPLVLQNHRKMADEQKTPLESGQQPAVAQHTSTAELQTEKPGQMNGNGTADKPGPPGGKPFGPGMGPPIQYPTGFKLYSIMTGLYLASFLTALVGWRSITDLTDTETYIG